MSYFIAIGALCHHVDQKLTVEGYTCFVSKVLDVIFEDQSADVVGRWKNQDIFIFKYEIFELDEADNVNRIIFKLNIVGIAINSYTFRSFPRQKPRPWRLSII